MAVTAWKYYVCGNLVVNPDFGEVFYDADNLTVPHKCPMQENDK